ncbi:hypothetical protein ACWGIB_07980 [Streptomyces xiamenensis]
MRVEPMGPVLATIANLFGAGLLGGGGWLAVSFTHGALSDPETTVDAVVFAAVALFGAFVASVGLGTLLHNRERRRSTRRLATQGVDGAAEVIAIGPGEVMPDGLATQHELRLRVTGPGFEPFEASSVEPDNHFPGVVVGSRLAVVVHPPSREFSLHRAEPVC